MRAARSVAWVSVILRLCETTANSPQSIGAADGDFLWNERQAGHWALWQMDHPIDGSDKHGVGDTGDRYTESCLHVRLHLPASCRLIFPTDGAVQGSPPVVAQVRHLD
jgi:hypothetical protein